MEKNITVIKGDGIGPEIVNEALKVLDAIADKYNHKFNYTQILMGGDSIDEYGVPLTDEALKKGIVFYWGQLVAIRQHHHGIN